MDDNGQYNNGYVGRNDEVLTMIHRGQLNGWPTAV